MPEPRDVIISSFASSGKKLKIGDEKVDLQTFSQPLDVFTDEPILLHVDATTQGGEIFYDKAFAREVQRYRDEEGYILRRFLRSHLADVKVRRICCIGFSAGGTFVKAVLNGPDAQYVDSAIFLDAIHLGRPYAGAPPVPESLAGLVKYGVRAASAPGEWDGPMMVQAHTSIATPHESVTSTTESAAAITAQVAANSPGAVRTGYDPALLLAPPPPPAIELGPNVGLPKPSKVFDSVPVPTGVSRGNYRVFNFGGTYGADHAFIAWFVQRNIFKAFLAPRWNEGMNCKPTDGLGQEFCGPGGIIVPDGTYEVPGGANWPAALAGLAVGVGLGLWAGSRV
jgi:hypothetical protein